MIDPLRVAIRIARPGDTGAIGALLAASYSTLLADRYDSDVLAQALPSLIKANSRLLASGTYYVAEIAPANLVGCGGWTIEPPGNAECIDGEAHIRHFATHPDWARHGVAGRLLTRCIGASLAIGIRKLHCFSTLNAESFYQSYGFVTVGPVDIPLAPGLKFPSIAMRRDVA